MKTITTKPSYLIATATLFGLALWDLSLMVKIFTI